MGPRRAAGSLGDPGRQAPRRPLDPDPGGHEVDAVARELLGGPASRPRFTAGPAGPADPADPGVDEVEERLRRERAVDRAQLPGAHPVVEDLLQRREEVPEERAAGLTELIDRERDAALAEEPRSAAAGADQVGDRGDEARASG